MSLKPETIAQLQTLIQADPALLAQLQSGTDAASASSAITKAAAAKGVEVSAEELTAHLNQTSKAPIGMADEELEKISAGGGWMMSILTLGVGCAIISIEGAVNSKSDPTHSPNCATAIRNL